MKKIKIGFVFFLFGLGVLHADKKRMEIKIELPAPRSVPQREIAIQHRRRIERILLLMIYRQREREWEEERREWEQNMKDLNRRCEEIRREREEERRQREERERQREQNWRDLREIRRQLEEREREREERERRWEQNMRDLNRQLEEIRRERKKEEIKRKLKEVIQRKLKDIAQREEEEREKRREQRWKKRRELNPPQVNGPVRLVFPQRYKTQEIDNKTRKLSSDQIGIIVGVSIGFTCITTSFLVLFSNRNKDKTTKKEYHLKYPLPKHKKAEEVY